MPRANSCTIVVVVNAHRPKQIVAAHELRRPTAMQMASVTTSDVRGHVNW